MQCSFQVQVTFYKTDPKRQWVYIGTSGDHKKMALPDIQRGEFLELLRTKVIEIMDEINYPATIVKNRWRGIILDMSGQSHG
jgi:hypothetical protein